MNLAPSPDEAWYVYAVLPGGADPVPRSPALLAGSEVRVLRHGAVAALVSLVPRGLFAADHPQSRAADPHWVALCAEAHHRVVQSAASAGPCLPLGFGTLFTSENALRAWLSGNADRMTRALAMLSDRQEWALTLTEDACVHAAWLEAHDPDIRTLAQAARAAPPGTQFLLERRLAKALDAARARHGVAAGAMLMERLQAEQVELRQEAARQGAAWSALACRHSRFAERIEALSAALFADSGLALRITGPWPPYAFARAAWQEQAHA